MNSFEYYNPVRILFGAGELKKIGEEARKLGHKVCIVSYKELNFLKPLINKIEMLLGEAGLEVFSFYEAEPNPEITTIAKGAEFCRVNAIELVIGV